MATYDISKIVLPNGDECALKDAEAREAIENIQDNNVTGVKGNAESTYRTGNVNLTPANIGAADASTHQYKFYSDPAQLGLSGDNTVLQIYKALPGNSVIVTSRGLLASDMPGGSTTGELLIWNIGGSRTHVLFYGKRAGNGTWRMYLGASNYNDNDDNAPDGTWHRVYDGSTVVPLSAGGTGGIGLVTVSATVSIPSVAAGGATELSFSNPDSSKYKLLCISGWNLTKGFVPYIVGVHAGGSTALSRLNVRNVTSSALSGTAVIQWLAVQLN